MSKEQIQTICDDAKVITDNDNKMIRCHINIKYFDWLIEQTERVQELEEVVRSNFKHHKHQQEMIFGLEQQNKHYREALEFYADEGTYEVVETLPPTDEYHQPIEPVFKTVPIIYYDKGKEARKALEEGTDE